MEQPAQSPAKSIPARLLGMLRGEGSMRAIFRKETGTFFNSLIAYIVLTVFLTGVGLFFWVFGENVLLSGEANLDDLFFFAPWFFLFLIPAITMRSFAEEFKTGTIEFLSTKPLTDWQLILGKFLSATFLVMVALLPTLIYFISLSLLSVPDPGPGEVRTGFLGAIFDSRLDTGPMWGAYIGLVGLGSVFVAIGIFCSSLTENQIVAFVTGLFLCFFFFYGFQFLADLDSFSAIARPVARMGINAHFESISLGVVDTRDILYFISMVLAFLWLTRLVLAYRRR